MEVVVCLLIGRCLFRRATWAGSVKKRDNYVDWAAFLFGCMNRCGADGKVRHVVHTVHVLGMSIMNGDILIRLVVSCLMTTNLTTT